MKVSVLIPCHNYRHLVGEAIDSVLAQDYDGEVEIICIDDGSTDGSFEAMQAFGDRIVAIRQDNAGMCAALNSGFERAGGDIVSFLDADDTWLPGKLKHVVREFRAAPDLTMVYHRPITVDAAGRQLASPWYDSDVAQGDVSALMHRDCLPWRFMPTSTLSLSRRAAALIFPVATSLRGNADDLIAGCAALLGPVRCLPQQLSRYRIHGDNLWAAKFLAAKRRGMDEPGETETPVDRTLIDADRLDRAHRYVQVAQAKAAHGNRVLARARQAGRLSPWRDPDYRRHRIAVDGGAKWRHAAAILDGYRQLSSDRRWPLARTALNNHFSGPAEPAAPAPSDHCGSLTMPSIVANDVLGQLTDATRHLRQQLGRLGATKAAIWGCSETGEAVAALLRAAEIELTDVYDSFATGEFAGRTIRHPDSGFASGVPVIIASSRPRPQLSAIVAILEQAGVPYLFCDRQAGPATLSLAAFKDRHKGQRAFVLGNGPSLNQTDMTKLRSEITFGSNRVYLGFDKWGFNVDYWAIEDQLVGEDIAAEWNELSGPVRFVPRDMAAMVKNHENLCWVNFRRDGFGEEGPHFNTGGEEFFWGGTVTYLLLQLAVYMGCNPIYLVGVDFSYVRPDHVKELDGPTRWISHGDDPNHFTPGYFGAGRKWHDPNVARMGQAFTAARRAAAARDVRIYNATVETQLDVYEQVRFDDLFQ